jgi:DNA-binding NarL/FixJ family response regulator
VKTIRVLLADDHTLVLAGIRGLLTKLAGVEVVGEAADGHETLRLAETLRPDIILLDIGMPGLNGLEVAQRLNKLDPNIRVVILSMHVSEEYVLRALHAGASGYLLKDSAVAELEVAIRAVARGETYLSPPVSKRVVDDYVSRTGGIADPLASLTPRQREILQLVAEGHSNSQLARMLWVTEQTVKFHLSNIYRKLDVANRTEASRWAHRHGLVGRREAEAASVPVSA